MAYNKYLNSQEFVDNNAKRIPVCIVVDCSGSMKEMDGTSKSRIERVNDGIKLFYNGVKNNSKAHRAVDVLIIQVGNEAKALNHFSSTEVNPPQLKYLIAKNNLIDGVRLALTELDKRKETYKKANIDYYQPWLLIMSDGGVNEELGQESLESIQKEVKKREAEGKLSIFPVYVQRKPVWNAQEQRYYPIKMETYDKRKQLMSHFSQDSHRLIDIVLEDSRSFEDLFQFLHKSASSVANNKGLIKTYKTANFATAVFPSSLEQYESASPVSEEPTPMETTNPIDNATRIAEERQALKDKEKNTNINTSILSTSEDNPVVPKVYSLWLNKIQVSLPKTYHDDAWFFTLDLHLGDDITVKCDHNDIYQWLCDTEGSYEVKVDALGSVSLKFINSIEKSHPISPTADINEKIEAAIKEMDDWDEI